MTEAAPISILPPESVPALKALGYNFLRFGQAARGRKLLRVLVNADPNDAETGLLLAWAELECGETALAQEALDRVAASCTKHPGLHGVRALLALQSRDLEVARAALAEAQLLPHLSQNPGSRK